MTLPSTTMPPAQPPQRDGSLDILKGFLIILVVIGHSGIGAALPHGSESFAPALLLRALNILPPIYYFHIALFFTVSAVVMKVDSGKKVATRLAQLVMMYCFWMCWPVIWYLIKAYIDHPHIEFLPFWKGNVSPWLMTQLSGFAWGTWTRSGILWFVPAMVGFSLLTTIILWTMGIAKTTVARTAVVAALIACWVYFVGRAEEVALVHVAGRIPWGVDVALYLVPLGLLHRWIYLERVRFAAIPSAYLVCSAVLGEILITVFEPTKVHSPYHYKIDFAQFSVAASPLGVVGFTVLTSSLFLLALRIKGIGFLGTIGRYSLPIFVMHMYFIETDWIKTSGAVDQWATLMSPGLGEGLRYGSRLAGAVLIPIAISVSVGSIVPFARPLGFIAPPSILAWRRSAAQWIWHQFKRPRVRQ